MTAHEQAARALLEGLLDHERGGETIQGLWRGLKQDRWTPEYLAAVGQSHWSTAEWPMEQLAAFGLVHGMLMDGRVAEVQISTGGTPMPDCDRQENQRLLANLPGPFVARVDEQQNNADQDGQLKWDAPILVEKSTGAPFFQPCRQASPEPLNAVVPFAAGSVPLEIGTTKPSKTLEHIKWRGGVARWPYGHDRLTVFVMVDPNYNPLEGAL